MHLFTHIEIPSCGVVHDLQSVYARATALTSSPAPVAYGKYSCRVYINYIDRTYCEKSSALQKIPHWLLDSIRLNSGIRILLRRLTQKFASCKQLQRKFPVSLFPHTQMRSRMRSTLTGIKYSENNVLLRKLPRNPAVLTILIVSATISTFIKRKQKRARVHLGLHRRSRCFGNSEGWDNVYAVRSRNQHLITKCHALIGERVSCVRCF